jgi:hypothetical protein
MQIPNTIAATSLIINNLNAKIKKLSQYVKENQVSQLLNADYFGNIAEYYLPKPNFISNQCPFIYCKFFIEFI